MHRITSDSEAILFRFSYSASDVFIVKTIDCHKWSKTKKAWVFPLEESILKKILNKFPDSIVDECVYDDLAKDKIDFEKAIKLKQLLLNKVITKFQNFLNLPFYNHQLKAFNLFSQLDIAIDFSQMGCGKTMVQIALLKYRILYYDISKILIIAPIYIAEDVWVNEIPKFAFNDKFTFPIYLLTETGNLTSKEYVKEVLQNNDDGIYIINYAKLNKAIDYLKKIKWDFIIVDESSKIKNNQAKRTSAIMKLSDARFKSILTGTPAPNHLIELFPQVKFISKKIFGKSIVSFKELFFHKIPETFELIPKEGTRDEFKRRLSPYMLAFKKKDCLDLPPLTIQNLYVVLSDEQKKAYKSLEKEMIAIIEDKRYTAQIKIVQIMRLAQITSGFLQNTDGADFITFKDNPKMDYMLDKIEQISYDDKTLIWCHFRQDSIMIQERLSKLYGKNSSVIYNGLITKQEKSINKARFLNDKNCRFFIANPKSAGMGLNLSVANYSFYYSASHSFEDYDQSRERYNREGQFKNMTEFRLISKKTIDELIFKCIERKRNTNDFITDMKEFLNG